MALHIGNLSLASPVILAPMAGVTNMAFRMLCREIEQEKTGTVSGLYVCEMITARAVVARNEKTLAMMRFHPSESPRSLQLHTADPKFTYEAARYIVDNDLTDHLDINFGCPVPKVTRRGSGAAIPFKRRLFGEIVAAAVRAADGRIPVTVKFRLGIDDDHRTDLDAGRIAEEEGAAAMTLHARTAAERYSGEAHWDEIARLKEHVSIPVLGNGDIFRADDARRMMERTGCDGVEVGRGCLGRPWLFAELSANLRGVPVPEEPALGEVTSIMLRHARWLAKEMGEDHACRDFRKHIGWYMRGFPVGGQLRKELSQMRTLAQMEEILAPYRDSDVRAEHSDDPRGRQGSPAKVLLPEGWLDDPQPR